MSDHNKSFYDTSLEQAKATDKADEMAAFLKKPPKQMPLPMKAAASQNATQATTDTDGNAAALSKDGLEKEGQNHHAAQTETTIAEDTPVPASKLLAGKIELNDLRAGRSYWFVMAGLVLVILITAVKTAHQTQERHEVYRKLTQARQQYQSLQTEETRLIIEQQTFSATPIVAQRAVVELGMFYPTQKNRIIIHLE